MKGQGSTVDDGVVGDKDKSNNNLTQNNISLEEEEDLDDSEEEAGEEDVEEVGINASMVVNLSESQSRLNFNSFSFNSRNNQNDSTINSSDDSDLSSNSPLASSRSAPPDLRDYSSSANTSMNVGTHSSSSNSSNPSTIINNNSHHDTTISSTPVPSVDKENNEAPSTPASNNNSANNVGTGAGGAGIFLNNEKPTFTSTPKHPHSTGVLSNNQQQQINGGNHSVATPTTSVPTSSATTNTNINDNESGIVKKKLSVTFADIVKSGNGVANVLPPSGNANIPSSILSDDELDDDEDEDFSESVYFSLGQTPPSSNNDLSIERPQQEQPQSSQKPSTSNQNNYDDEEDDDEEEDDDDDSKITDSSYDATASVNNQSELDMASVSARVNGHSEDSMVTLMNVSSCNNSIMSQDGHSVRSLLVNNSKVGAGDGPNNVIDDEAADEEVHKINANLLLPNTVTELVAANGVKVYVVGTAHFSEQSQKDVIETIQKLQPTLVVLELCHSRRNILTLDEETILRDSADMSLSKVKDTINQSGAVQGTLHLLLLSMSAQLTKKLGMAPGGEFRVAVKEARNIPGCLLLLGDRPIKVTLSRALAALSLGQKLKLAWQFLTSNEDITKDEIERCKEKDLLERMMMEMTGEFPAISRVFVNERDIYLAHSLWLAATSASHPNQGGPIVGVVGMGHVAGIIRNWGQTTEEHIAELISIPEPTMTSIVIRASLKLSFYALMGYGVYRLTQRVFDFPPKGLIYNTVYNTFERLPDLASKSIARVTSR